MKFSEVVDSPENAREFLNLNKIKQNQIISIVIIWEEEDES